MWLSKVTLRKWPYERMQMVNHLKSFSRQFGPNCNLQGSPIGESPTAQQVSSKMVPLQAYLMPVSYSLNLVNGFSVKPIPKLNRVPQKPLKRLTCTVTCKVHPVMRQVQGRSEDELHMIKCVRPLKWYIRLAECGRRAMIWRAKWTVVSELSNVRNRI